MEVGLLSRSSRAAEDVVLVCVLNMACVCDWVGVGENQKLRPRVVLITYRWYRVH